jgi:transcriptional antiterminator NusG
MIKQQHEEEGLGILTPEVERKKEEPKKVAPAPVELPPLEEQPRIFAIKTQVGQERNVADMLEAKIKKAKGKAPIFSVLAPQELRGYLFVEGGDKQAVENIVKAISYARTLLGGEVPFTEIEHFLTPVSAVAKISEGDIVELIAGPFRGEKAKVTRIDENKEEITVELFEAMVPIPITVKGEQVRVLKRKGS